MGETMTNKILTSELTGKTVMTQGGFPMGQIDDVVIDTETGEFLYLLVNTTQSSKFGQQIDDKGHTVLTFNTMKISGNNVIIS